MRGKRGDATARFRAHLAHDRFEDAPGEHLGLVADVRREITERHRGHSLTVLVVRAKQRDEVRLRALAQNRVAVLNVGTEVPERARCLALHQRRRCLERLQQWLDGLRVNDRAHVLNDLRNVHATRTR